MPNPAGLNTTLLHMRFVEPDSTATPLQGTLTFTPNPSPILFPDENVIVAGTETVTLDANGEATIELISTDQAGQNPNGWVYTVVEKILGQRQRSYNILLPFTDGMVVELSDIQPTEAAPQYIPVVGPQGPPGLITTVNGYSSQTITLTAADVQAIPTSQKGAASGVATLTASGKHTAAEYDGNTVVLASTRGVAGGVATLDSGTKIPVTQIPDLSSTYITNARINAANGVAGLGAGGLVGSAQLDLASSAPPSVGTAAVGTSTKLARQDHTHSGVDLSTTQTVGGAKTFSANLSLAAGARLIQFAADATSLVQTVFINGEANDRWQMKSAGDMYWGPGNVVQDTSLKRTGVNELTASGQLVLGSTAPTAAGHATRKDYVDNNFSSLTGAQTISGVKTFTGAPIVQQSAAGTVALNSKVSGDANSRFTLAADGTMNWGPGNAATDSILFRDGANQLALSNTLLRVYRAAATSAAYSTLVSGDVSARFYYQADGKMFWGPGNASPDVNLYRSAVDVLKTDDAFVVGGQLTVGTAGIYVISDWAPLSTVGSFQNGCTAGTPTPKVRKIMYFGREVWELEGAINLPGTYGGSTMFSFTNGASSPYTPSSEHTFAVAGGTGSTIGPVRAYWNTSGNMGISPTFTAGAIPTLNLQQMRIVNPLNAA